MPSVAIKDIQEIDKKVDNYQKNPPQAFSEAAGDFCYIKLLLLSLSEVARAVEAVSAYFALRQSYGFYESLDGVELKRS